MWLRQLNATQNTQFCLYLHQQPLWARSESDLTTWQMANQPCLPHFLGVQTRTPWAFHVELQSNDNNGRFWSWGKNGSGGTRLKGRRIHLISLTLLLTKQVAQFSPWSNRTMVLFYSGNMQKFIQYHEAPEYHCNRPTKTKQVFLIPYIERKFWIF